MGLIGDRGWWRRKLAAHLSVWASLPKTARWRLEWKRRVMDTPARLTRVSCILHIMKEFTMSHVVISRNKRWVSWGSHLCLKYWGAAINKSKLQQWNIQNYPRSELQELPYHCKATNYGVRMMVSAFWQYGFYDTSSYSLWRTAQCINIQQDHSWQVLLLRLQIHVHE